MVGSSLWTRLGLKIAEQTLIPLSIHYAKRAITRWSSTRQTGGSVKGQDADMSQTDQPVTEETPETDTEGFSVANQIFWYQARVLRVVDGDTLELMVDQGFNSYRKLTVRLYGIDTPETNAKNKRPEEYAEGMRATNFVDAWAAAQGNVVLIRSHDGKAIKTDSLRRWLVEVYGMPDKTPLANILTGKSLNQILVEKGLAEEKTY